MTNYESIPYNDKDKFAEWLSKLYCIEDHPWRIWLDETYCKKCINEVSCKHSTQCKHSSISTGLHKNSIFKKCI